jgi:23S rRNA (cytosine1962-C5)-methyltransferase
MEREAQPVIITRRAAAQLRSGYLWVFSTEVVDAAGAHTGSIVRVVDNRQKPIGYAIYSDRSKIALRWVAATTDRIDRDFWRRRLMAALDHRRHVVANTEALRVVFAESDLLPSLIIDRYGDYFVMQTLTPGMDAMKPLWVEPLIELFAPQAIIERNDVKMRQLEGLEMQKGVLYGSVTSEPVVAMNGVRFHADLLEGQKTGLFLDQRENYELARTYSRGRALDCFCYSGGFALHIARQCDAVLAVDLSAEALNEARTNAEINNLKNIEFLQANVFDLLRDLVNQNERFSMIVLDPPAFAKSREAVEGAIRGYKEINLRALRLLEPGGILITCSCSYHMSEQMFLGVLASAAADARRQVRLLEKRKQARDHPILLSMPETYYLKCIVLQVF